MPFLRRRFSILDRQSVKINGKLSIPHSTHSSCPRQSYRFRAFLYYGSIPWDGYAFTKRSPQGQGIRSCFERTLKNGLTGQPMGGAKGGANFNPRGKSHREGLFFCRCFMSALADFLGSGPALCHPE
jgi:hypothetical protein